MNQKRPSRQQLAHLSAALYQAFRPAYLSDLGPSLHAISSLSHLIDGMKASVGRLLDVEVLPAGLQCHFCHEGGTPSLHILSDPVSQANPASKRNEKASAARAAEGRHLLAIPDSEGPLILEFARHPVDYLAKALGVDVQEMREWLGEKPASRQCAWDGCESTEVIGTAMARGLQPLEAAQNARLEDGDLWLCPDHATEAFRSLGSLPDGLCRKLTHTAILNSPGALDPDGDIFTAASWASDAPNVPPPTDDELLTDWEKEFLIAFGLLEAEPDSLTGGPSLTSEAEVLLIDWIANRTRRRAVHHRLAEDYLKGTLSKLGAGLGMASTEAPETPTWPGAVVSRLRLAKPPTPPQSASWRALDAFHARTMHWVLTTSPWAHWTPVQASPSATDETSGKAGGKVVFSTVADAAPGCAKGSRLVLPIQVERKMQSGAEQIWQPEHAYPAEPTLCGVWHETGKMGVCKDGPTVCRYLRALKQDHALCVSCVA